MANTAPNDAPDETPIIEGEASGLRNIPCIINPHIAKLAPANEAMSIRGNRTSNMILDCQSGYFVEIDLIS